MGRSIAWILAATLAAPAAAEESGEQLYATYCAACHGIGGEGDGPMAPLLTVAPTDLTGIAARNDGDFPVFETVRRIDGRGLLAHGGPMPVWGEAFEGEGAAIRDDDGQPILTSAPIAELVRYIESIQR